MSREVKRRKRKIIDPSTEIVVANNTYGTFAYESKNGVLSIVLEENGDEEYITYSEARKLKKYFENMSLLIIDVNSDEDISIMDVVRGLRLTDVYSSYLKFVEGFNEDEFDEVEALYSDALADFVVDSDIDEFKEALKTPLRNAIVMTTVEMYKQRRLTNRDKQDLVNNRDEDFWADVDVSVKAVEGH
ncbi:hypothetical protein DKZ29_06140 [Limosilactobacillus reuteri]|jgi:hypothetical protein|uniref:Uncharacterized protein n=1 Tax=Limosilactobacillus reuteri TaxID=1598 RepID=A0A1V4FIH8_LIMRT|nr:hypothetical protein [Limosilactobacillus reuteri]MCC4359210.1 hypothetical protein [Limosilactobacillus reuteri]MCC4361651.1 hypothetical protein [Limosilactobacillus reuteri]MCC4365512.1 hypothetical protein [Limosilactobacillus reuteri]MCC4389117.1 hypothetical protein [Limosilactobacillus reuteri]MCC4427807.1 hypothetical protein [Limosilactobacillus reuteri]